VIAYDADALTKEPVRVARSELAAHLRGRGAVVGFLEWDISRGKGIYLLGAFRAELPGRQSRPKSSPLAEPSRRMLCCYASG
jgi:hypothetical protein